MKYFFSPNKKNISCLTFTKSGKYILAGEGTSKNPEILIFDLTTDQLFKSLKGHKFGIEILKMSPNEKYLISIGDENDKGIFVWDF